VTFDGREYVVPCRGTLKTVATPITRWIAIRERTKEALAYCPEGERVCGTHLQFAYMTAIQRLEVAETTGGLWLIQ
jgi:hypothetical protein